MKDHAVSINRVLADRMTVPDDLETAKRKIFVKDLVLSCSIGVYPQERLAPQRVRINVAMHVGEPDAPLNDEIDNVVSYDTVVTAIKALIGRGHINLVETLADEIAAICLADRRVMEVKVTVEKLDIEPDAAAVGVEIERRRKVAPPMASIHPLLAAAGSSAARRRDGRD
ncbi:dihydroneopterin aldolase [Virgifigura deserti]|uniref:dihydroneopterin aldolase n=1 Tax=Virgifigura deserti TaxID=2268457 RepID=UPI003CCC3DB2